MERQGVSWAGERTKAGVNRLPALEVLYPSSSPSSFLPITSRVCTLTSLGLYLLVSKRTRRYFEISYSRFWFMGARRPVRVTEQLLKCHLIREALLDPTAPLAQPCLLGTQHTGPLALYLTAHLAQWHGNPTRAAQITRLSSSLLRHAECLPSTQRSFNQYVKWMN